ncbi:MAG: TetR family transcriptional regulator [Alphaproteobacteria bacterium]|nr:TetR family transcriptional regulator [Alphaproteobacteria bacterium]
MSATTPQLRWIKAPLQERSERTLESLLDAAERILEVQPLQSAGVSAIAKEAGSSVGAFYHRFPDKQALARTLYQRFRNQSLATVKSNFDPSQWDGHDLASVIDALIGFTAHDYLLRPGLRRFAMHLVESDPDIRNLSKQLSGAVVDAFEELLVARRAEYTHPDPRLAAEFLHRMMFSMLDQVALFHGEAPTGNEITEEVLVRELSDAIKAYLGVKPAGA